MKKANLIFAVIEFIFIFFGVHLIGRDVDLGLIGLAIIICCFTVLMALLFTKNIIVGLEIEGKDKRVLWFASIIFILIFLTNCSYLRAEYLEIQDYCWENQDECICTEQVLIMGVSGQTQETEESIEVSIDMSMFPTCDQWVLIENIRS